MPADRPPRSRRGAMVVLAMLALGAALALVARKYRVPGSAPRLRLVPTDEDLRGGRTDFVLPPAKEVPVRPVSRVRFLAAGTGADLEDIALGGPRLEGTPRRGGDGIWLLEFTPGTRERPAPREEEIVVARPAGATDVVLSVAARPSNREDGLDVPVLRVTIP